MKIVSYNYNKAQVIHDKEQVIHSKNDNIETMINEEADEVIR